MNLNLNSSSVAGRVRVTPPGFARIPAKVRNWAGWLGRRDCFLPILAGVLVALGGNGCSREAKKARHLQRAEHYYQAEQYEKAEIEYLNVLRIETAHRGAITRLGYVSYYQGNPLKARYFLEKAAPWETNNLDFRLKLGSAWLVAGGLTNARAEALYILDRQPTNNEALMLLADTALAPKEIEKVRGILQNLRTQADRAAGYHAALGVLHLRQQSVPVAEGEFKQALALEPKYAGAYAGLAVLYAMSNDLKQAEQFCKTAAELSPWRSGSRLAYAGFKAQTGDLEAARQILEEVVQKAPDYIPAWISKAKIALEEKKYDDCGAFVGRVLAKDAVHYEALSLKGRLQLAKNEFSQALPLMERTAKLYPGIPLVHYELGICRLLNTNVTGAISSLNTATRLNPTYTEAVVLLAQLNTRSGDPGAAVASLTGFIDKAPNFIQPYLSLANAYRTLRNWGAALDIYQRLAVAFRASDQPALRTNALPDFMSGLVLLEEKKTNEARAMFEKAVALMPDNLQVVQQLVGIDIAQKQYPRALQHLQKPLERDVKSQAPLLLLAGVQLAQGRTNEAEVALEKAIEVDTNGMGAYMVLAQLYAMQGRHSQAIEKLNAAVAKNRASQQSWLLMGLIHDAVKDYSAARDAYERVLVLNPRSGPVLNNLAYLYSEHLNQPEKAYERATQAREQSPQDPGTADTLGWIFFKRGEYSRALGLLQESAAKLPDEPEVLYHLAMARYMMGEEEASRAAFLQALRPGRALAGKDEAERRLALLNLDVKTAGPEMTATLEKRLAEQPGDMIALVRLAALHERGGAFDKVAQQYEKALKINPRAVAVLVKLARLYGERLGDPKKAFDMAKSARLLAPDDPTITPLLGRLAYRIGDHKWALNLLQESAQKLGQDPEILCDLALALYSNGRITEAETTMKTALQANPTFSRAEAAKRFLTLSTLYVNPAKAQQSQSLIQEALKADPDYIPALMASGVLYEQARKEAEAKQIYERIVAISPQFSPAVRQLAMICGQDSKENKRAYELGVRAREAFPQDAALARMLGMVSFRSGEYNRAADLLKESARTSPNDAEVFYCLGMAHHQLKARKEAAAALNRALALNLPSPLAEEAKRVLATLK